jgi:hypothetical protein
MCTSGSIDWLVFNANFSSISAISWYTFCSKVIYNIHIINIMYSIYILVDEANVIQYLPTSETPNQGHDPHS